MEKLPEPFVMLEIETRIKEKTPFVVVALQEVGKGLSCAEPHLRAPAADECGNATGSAIA
jgi:hypothetical protein